MFYYFMLLRLYRPQSTSALASKTAVLGSQHHEVLADSECHSPSGFISFNLAFVLFSLMIVVIVIVSHKPYELKFVSASK